jgi:hypothetical protein
MSPRAGRFVGATGLRDRGRTLQHRLRAGRIAPCLQNQCESDRAIEHNPFHAALLPEGDPLLQIPRRSIQIVPFAQLLAQPDMEEAGERQRAPTTCGRQAQPLPMGLSGGVELPPHLVVLGQRNQGRAHCEYVAGALGQPIGLSIRVAGFGRVSM